MRILDGSHHQTRKLVSAAVPDEEGNHSSESCSRWTTAVEIQEGVQPFELDLWKPRRTSPWTQEDPGLHSRLLSSIGHHSAANPLRMRQTPVGDYNRSSRPHPVAVRQHSLALRIRLSPLGNPAPSLLHHHGAHHPNHWTVPPRSWDSSSLGPNL